MNLSIRRNYPAFTIVELLIVIVVIAILAAISIVAYNGIQSRARASSASSAATQAAKKLALYQVDAGTYPATGNLSGAGVVSSGGTNYQYTGSGSTYCLTTSVGGTSFSTTGSQSPQSGTCPGHVNGGAITNLVTNPSFEVNTNSWGASGPSSIARLTGGAPSGNAYLRLHRVTSGDVYAAYTLPGAAPAPNSAYTLSFWMWADGSRTVDGLLFRTSNDGSCCSNIATRNNVSVTATPSRIVMSGSTGSNPTSPPQVILRATATNGDNIYYDGFMITEGPEAYSYGDGNSSGWSWSGTANNSTSAGPEL